MQLRNWNLTWKLLFLLLISLPCIQSHVLHYMHLKKFLTAIAFARALGKRPTVLPIPIPIPIPIAQNEVIKIPMGGNTAKTTILDGSKGSSQAAAIAQLLGGLGSSYAGSSKYGYALPSTNNPRVINLSQLKGSDSNIVNSLASALSNGGQTKVLILGGGQNPGGAMATSPSVIHLGSVPGSMAHSNLMGSVPGSSVLSHSNLMGSGLNFGGLTGMDPGFNSGSGFGDLGLGSSFSNIFQLPQNAYSNKSRRNPHQTHRGHNMRGGNGHSSQTGGNGHSFQNGGNGHSSQNGGNSHSFQNGGNGHSSQNGGNGHSSQNGGNSHSFQNGGNGHSTQNGGNGQSFQNGGNGHSFQNGGNGHSPQNGGNSHSSQYGGNGHSFQNGGNGHSTENGGNSKTCEHCHRPLNNRKRPVHENLKNAPLSVKFTYRP